MKTNKKLWVVGEFVESTAKGTCWEFTGVFDEKRKAKRACTTVNSCIFSTKLNIPFPLEFKYPPDAEYPICSKPFITATYI